MKLILECFKYPHYQSFKLKKRLFEEKIKFNRCEKCNTTNWNDKP